MKRLLKKIVNTVSPRLAQNAMARDLFFFVARDFTPSLTASMGKYRYQVSTADRTVGREVFLTGGFDSGCIEHIFEILRQLGVKDFHRKLFIDIGANIGTTSIPVVAERGFCGGIAIEPEPANFALLTGSIAINGLQERVRCVNVALSDSVGEGEMELCPVNMGDHRLRSPSGVANDGIYHERSRDLVTVKTMTFDALVADGTIPIDNLGVVWIDTQGHEGHVLQGAQRLFETDVPVVVEFWPYALSRAGGLELFERLVCEHYSHFVDTRATGTFSHEALQPVKRLSKLKDRYVGPALTDIVLIK